MVLTMTTTNYNIQTGKLIDENGKNFDISVILNFPTEADYDEADYDEADFDDFPAVNLIDFYFGEINDHDTEYYVNQFVEKQNKLLKLRDKLLDVLSANPEDSEIREHIDFVNSMLVQLH